jgi:two-component system chemotaxis response regulator CheB
MSRSDPIRVLVVDSSPEVRRIVTEYLAADPSIEVIGVASNYSTALRQIEKLEPDIVTLHEDLYDQTYEAVLKHPDTKLKQLPLVVLGTIDDSTKSILQAHSHTKRGKHPPRRKRAIVCKSPGDRRFTEICRRIHEIVQLASRPVSARATPAKSPSSGPLASSSIDIVGIAVSTGGPNALLRIVSALSPEFPAPIVITQHMPGQFTPLLAERLNSRSPLQVCEAYHQQPIESGWIYIAPGDQHLTIQNISGWPHAVLTDGPKENSCRPSADVMFRSIADVFGDRALALVLTGMGVDGQLGCSYLKEKGGIIIAQDEDSSTVWGMPKAVVHAGLADEVLALDDIAQSLNQRLRKIRHGT